jgi:hypothetical protein
MTPESQMDSPHPTHPTSRSSQPDAGTEATVGPDTLDQAAAPATQSTGRPATVIVRGEAVSEPQQTQSPSKGPNAKRAASAEPSVNKEAAEARLRMRDRLPALADDGDVGIEKEQLVVRDEKADLRFTGVLIASAAPERVEDDYWWEYRIYETTGGKHVFSKVARTLAANKPDRHEAEVFDPAPSSVPSQLLRGARDLTRSRPLEWTDAAVKFFGYNALAKILYRKLGDQFDEHIS